MPNCFTLTRKSDLATGPVALQAVDEELCKNAEAPCDPERWYKNWYPTIGLGLALGNSWDRLREIYPNKLAIIDYLEANFTTDAWAER